MTSMLNMNEIGILDRQILQLHDYKPIPENEVKNLCDKVSWKTVKKFEIWFVKIKDYDKPNKWISFRIFSDIFFFIMAHQHDSHLIYLLYVG